jgi:hypothetical protein
MRWLPLEAYFCRVRGVDIGLPSTCFMQPNPPSSNPKMPPPRLKILFVTGSDMKLADVKSYLSPYDIVIESTPLDLPEVQAATVEEIAREKCRLAAEDVSVLNLDVSFVLDIRWAER